MPPGAPRSRPSAPHVQGLERAWHTWFASTHLLGFDKVRSSDGSWTEWGNAVRLPLENP
jgi:thiosulfate/3-mercaptopyruvate sulfurtransferase